MRRVRLKPNSILKSRAYIHRLSLASKELGVSRHKLPDFLTDIWEYAHPIYDADGYVIPVLDIDPDTVLRTEEDPSCRWFSAWLSTATAGPKQSAQERIMPRIKLLVIGISALRPDLAEKYDF